MESTPTPSNIKWDELVAALASLGYKKLEGSGSRVKFYHEKDKDVISLHKPHPGNEVKCPYVKEVIEHLYLHGRTW